MPDSMLSMATPADTEIRPDHRNFVRYVMSDVYALLDYLSGRSIQTLAPPDPTRPQAGQRRRARALDRPDEPDVQEADGEAIENSLTDHGALLCRAMKIGQQLGKGDGDISPADAAFLITARDLLNTRAAPATGNSIVFTQRVVKQLRLARSGKEARIQTVGYHIEDALEESSAAALARFIRRQMTYMLVLLTVTLVLSTYVACGKLFLDTRDAVNRDLSANERAFADGFSHLDKLPDQQMIRKYCTGPRATFALDQDCEQNEEAVRRQFSISQMLRIWSGYADPQITPGDWDKSKLLVERVEQYATTLTGIMGNYVLPVLYGALGSFGFVLRGLNRQLADSLLTSRDLRANQIRIMLGVVTGACIGLFVNSSAGAATLTGLGGAAVTLSASGIAFLAGYSVEAVFRLLDSIMALAFRLITDGKPAPRADRAR